MHLIEPCCFAGGFDFLVVRLPGGDGLIVIVWPSSNMVVIRLASLESDWQTACVARTNAFVWDRRRYAALQDAREMEHHGTITYVRCLRQTLGLRLDTHAELKSLTAARHLVRLGLEIFHRERLDASGRKERPSYFQRFSISRPQVTDPEPVVRLKSVDEAVSLNFHVERCAAPSPSCSQESRISRWPASQLFHDAQLHSTKRFWTNTAPQNAQNGTSRICTRIASRYIGCMLHVWLR